jgi:hypothetical protein
MEETMATSDLLRHWGSSASERAERFACDGLVAPDGAPWFRAVDVAAPPATTWRWLCQLRAAPYSYDWIDNWGRPSPRALTPGLEALAPGQPVMRVFTLVSFERERQLTVRLRRPDGPFGDVAVSYRVSARPGGGSRLVAKVLVRRGRGLWAGLVRRLLLVGDFIMMRKQLLTLKRLAEATG